MPNPLNQVQTGNDYTDAATISFVYNSPGGTFDIQNANVFYKLQYLGKGMEEFTPEVLARPGAGVLTPPAVGIAFRSAVANTPATVSAFMAAESQPFAVVAATASASPGIVGIVAANGTILGGSGFSVNHTGTGVYAITYNTALAATPAVLVTVAENASCFGFVAPSSGTGCTINIVSDAGIFQDRIFNFEALAAV